MFCQLFEAFKSSCRGVRVNHKSKATEIEDIEARVWELERAAEAKNKA
jgi:hypothetical protein